MAPLSTLWRYLLLSLILAAPSLALAQNAAPVIPLVNGTPGGTTANPIVTTPSASGTANVNLSQVGGATAQTGHGVAAGSIRVELPTDGTGVVGLNTGSAIVGRVGIDQTTPGTTNAVSATNLPASVSVGTGAQGASSPRVTVATDTATVAGSATLPAGTNGIGNVGGKTTTVCVTPTVTATNAYGTNFVVGGLLTFSNTFTATGSGILQSVAVTVKKVETSGFTFVPFTSNPTNTTWTDAAVANINAADVAAVREPISLSAYSGLGTHTIAYADAIGAAMAPGATTFYGVLIANAALTNQFGSTSDVQVCIKVLNDL